MYTRMFAYDKLFTLFMRHRKEGHPLAAVGMKDVLQERFFHKDNVIEPVSLLVEIISKGLINVCNAYKASLWFFSGYSAVANEFIAIIKNVDDRNDCDLQKLFLLIMLTRGLEYYLYKQNSSNFKRLLTQFMQDNGLRDSINNRVLDKYTEDFGVNPLPFDPETLACSPSLADFICGRFAKDIGRVYRYFSGYYLDQYEKEVFFASLDKTVMSGSAMEYTTDGYPDATWKTKSIKKCTINALVEKLLAAHPAFQNQIRASRSLKY